MKVSNLKKRPKTVSDYINAAPADTRAKLKQLRTIIITAVPQAEEKLSYGMPYYGYKGRLAYFAYVTKHIGLYIPPPVIQQHKKELAPYTTAMATVRFPLDQKLPIRLISKLIKARVKINDSKK